jgi:hypothetical protein
VHPGGRRRRRFIFQRSLDCLPDQVRSAGELGQLGLVVSGWLLRQRFFDGLQQVPDAGVKSHDFLSGVPQSWGGLPSEDLVMAASLEDVPGDSNGHRRSIAVHEKPEYDQRERRDQHRFTAQSLDGMQGVISVSGLG